MNYEEFAPKLNYWAEAFRPFIESEEFYNIMQKIKNDAWDENGNRKEFIVPDSVNTFRTFATCHPDDLKVVMQLQDPYPRRYYSKGKPGAFQATGIAMDCSNSPDGKIQPSLKFFYEAMEREFGFEVEKSPDLLYLQEQGVMMLNTELTCKMDKTGSHEGYWEPFQKYFLEEVLRGKQIVFVLAGKEAQKMERYISPFGNTILKVDHPSSAQYGKTGGIWDSKEIFKTINNILKEQGKTPIMWNKRDWEKFKEDDLPF